VDDVRVQLDDGSYHETDSSEEAFRKAGALAFADAARKADPVVLEPMLRVRTVVPSEDAIGVTEMLCSRGGDIRSADILGDAKTIEARVPVSGLFGCGAELRSRTGGRGTCSMVFDGYRPIRGTPDVADEDRESRVGAPRRPSPKPRRDAVALPEPDDGAKD
jgi:elongation factor G